MVVRLYAALAGKRSPGIRAGDPIGTVLPDGAAVADLLSRLGLTTADVQTAFVNGRAQPLDHVLVEADEVGIFPPVGGG